MILLKNDEVIDFLTSPPTDFSALKNVQAEMRFNFQKPVTRLLPMTSEWRVDKQKIILFINYHRIIVLLKYFKKSRKQSQNSRKRFRLSGVTCHRDRSTKLWKTSQSNWRLVLELEVDTSNIHS